MKTKDIYYTFGIIVAISLALCAYLKSCGEGFKNKKVSLDNSPEWMLDVDQDTKKLQFIYQGHLKGDGKRVVAMNLTKDGNLTVARGFSFGQPKDQSWQISTDKNNALVLSNIAGGGIKLNPTGSILPVKYGKGGPMDFSELCIKEDGTSKVYANSC